MSDDPERVHHDDLGQVADWGPPEDWSDWLASPERRSGSEPVED